MATTNHLLPDEKEFARMEAELFGRLEHSHTRQVRRHRLVAVASIVLLASGGVAGVTEANQVAVARVAYCYSAANTNSRHAMAQYIDAHSQSDNSSISDALAMSAGLAVEGCDAIWSTGYFGSTATAPPLQACVRNDQVIAVFPKNDAATTAQFCDSLGMSAP
jgi:hypothetical protein